MIITISQSSGSWAIFFSTKMVSSELDIIWQGTSTVQLHNIVNPQGLSTNLMNCKRKAKNSTILPLFWGLFLALQRGITPHPRGVTKSHGGETTRLAKLVHCHNGSIG